MSIFDEFFHERQDLLKEIESIDSSRNISLVNSLKRSKDKVQFLSTISEARFGLFFDKISSAVKYNSKFGGNQTPDWNIVVNGQILIAEVARINPDNELNKSFEFSDMVFNAIMEIKQRYIVHVDFANSYSPRYEVDIPLLQKSLSDWFEIPRTVGESFIFDDNIEIIVHQDNCQEEHILAAGLGGPVKYRPQRLLGDNGRLMSKVDAYRELIAKQDVPYLVCIYADYHSWITTKDVYEGLYGPIEYLGTLGKCQNYSKGLYYSRAEGNDDLYNCVSGILFMQNDAVTYFHNYSLTNRLNQNNRELFLGYQYNVI